MMRRFNLSEWTLANRPLVTFIMLVIVLIGGWSCYRLGKSEDPPFAFKVMVIRTLWNGATADQVSRQVTEPIERAVMNTGAFELVRSSSRPGDSLVTFMARDDLRSSQIPHLWYQVRKRVGDIRATLPREVIGPFFNDEFGDTFGIIYALTGKEFDYATLRAYADRVQSRLQRLPDVGKVQLVGVQDEKIIIELSSTRLDALHISRQQLQQALSAQNGVADASFFETRSERLRVRVSGQFENLDEIRAFPIQVGDRIVHLGEIAQVSRALADPASPSMHFMGEDAIGLAVAMKDGRDVLTMGEALDRELANLQAVLPAGMQLRKVSDQSSVVAYALEDFLQILAEAIIIVLLVSFFSLGLRAGLVVAAIIPLVLLMTFAAMYYFEISLHRISLGALVLALGLLVDDAIIAVEMMSIKIAEGHDRLRAASFTWESTAWPMLTGTLITAAGFLPIAFAASSVGEYTRSLFQVVTIALVASWIAAVLFIPSLGDRLLPKAATRAKHGGATDAYQRPFYAAFRRLLDGCLRHRGWVIGAVIVLLVGSILLFRFVPRQFFPDSTRPELIVDLELAEGSSRLATHLQVEKLQGMLAKRQDVASYVNYVGTGSPRFYLPLDEKTDAINIAQFVVLAKDVEARERTRTWLQQEAAHALDGVQVRVTRLENGPPVGYPVQFRVSGEDIEWVKALARQVEAKVRANPHTTNVNMDWNDTSKVVRLVIDQDRARALGVTSAQLSAFLSSSLAGESIGVLRQGNRQIELLARGPAEERLDPALLSSLQLPTSNGAVISISQIASIEYGFEESVILHHDGLPTVTVRADIKGDLQPLAVVQQITPTLAAIRSTLPDGYLLETGGTVESTLDAEKSILAGIPLFVVVVMALLMLQLRSFSRAVMVLATGPLGIIGVTLFLLVLRVPFSFVAQLGTIALTGMIMRNSLILVDQIQQDIDVGNDRWHAIIDATVRRFRPVVLAAASTLLAMLPLSRSVFYGSMAISLMGGLVVGTVLTLVAVPALYAAWFRVLPDEAR